MFETSLSSKGQDTCNSLKLFSLFYCENDSLLRWNFLVCSSTHDAGRRIILNIGGTIFETVSANLDRLPVGRLANLQREGPVDGAGTGEYYFDRNSKAFSAMINFYRTGKLHMPKVRYHLRDFLSNFVKRLH